jgi:sulfite exporter TauE/SafE
MDSSMFITLLGSALAGLLGTPHCAAMCGGFASACASQQRGVEATVAYNAGRLATYATLGAIAGTVGSTLYQFRLLGLVLAAVFLVYFCARVAGFVPEVGPRIPGVGWLIRRTRSLSGSSGALFFGAATALLPCGLVYSALALPVVAASPVWGAAAMATFWAGTLPGLVGVAVVGSRIPTAGPALRLALAMAVLVTGTLGLVQRAPASVDAVPDCCSHKP